MLTTIISVGMAILFLVGLFKTFIKLDLPAWGAIIPIYNLYLLLVKFKFNPWLLVLIIIPGVNIIFTLCILFILARVFGLSTPMSILGALFSSLLVLYTGFSDAKPNYDI